MNSAALPPRIRRARWRDLHAIRDLVNEAYLPQAGPLGLTAHLRVHFWWHILNRRLWVVENEGQLQGMIGLHDGSMHLFMFLVAVRPTAQHRGLGRRLVEFAESEARRRRLTRLRLDTPEGFTTAIGFYRRLGFAEIGRQARSGYTSIVMMKRLEAIAPRP